MAVLQIALTSTFFSIQLCLLLF